MARKNSIKWVVGGQALSTTPAAVLLDVTGVPEGTGVIELSGLYLYVSSLAGGASAVTVRLTSDINGDFALMPDTLVDFELGMTTSTKGSAIIDLGRIIRPITATTYVWLDLDVGTATLVSAELTYST